MEQPRNNSRLTAFWILLISLALLVPCFWQSRIQAGDLGSHLYNAWLASQIKQGKLRGLWIAPDWTNVGFDISLTWLLEHYGAATAQRIAVSAAVLIFAWGAFAFIAAVSHRRPWFLLPIVAMLAYGYVFQMGFFNFYVSLGLCFWWLAMFWNGSARQMIAGVPLLVLATVAHALPVIWAIGIATYVAIARKLSGRGGIFLLLGAAGAIAGLREILVLRYRTDWSISQLFSMTGAEQVFLFDTKYLFVMAGLLLLWLVLLRSLRKSFSAGQAPGGVIIHLILLNALGVFLLPDRMQYSHPPGLGFISGRMSLPTAVFICALLGAVKPAQWQKALLALVCAIFFVFLYVDDRRANRLEDQLTAAMSQLPAQQRVVFVPARRRVRIEPFVHLLDRVCIGRCFSYANYEPPTGLFRIRVAGDNPYVVTRYVDSFELQQGQYIVKARDLPLYQIEACGASSDKLCVRILKAGERNSPAFATR